MRIGDRERARQRRTHQLGETEAHFQQRVAGELEQATGFAIQIARAADNSYVITAYRPSDTARSTPLIRVNRPNLLRAAREVRSCANQLNAGKEAMVRAATDAAARKFGGDV